VQRGPDGAFVFVVSTANQTNHIAKMRPIKVAQIDNGEALIDDGLEIGETVVVDGQYKLQDGSKVRPADPMGGTGSAHKKWQGKSEGTNQIQKP
jgi:multidrug efflux system membrane fusion protein